MKKYFLSIAGLIVLLFNQNGVAQHKAPTQAEMERFMHNMTADSTDKWEYSSVHFFNEPYAQQDLKFDVWIKQHLIDKIHYFFSYRNNGNVLSAQLYNTESVELATTSITRATATRYRYRVVTNDSVELVPWTTPSVFRSNKFTSYAFLGKFDCKHKTITLIIAEKNNKSNKSFYVYNSDDIPPVKISSMCIQYPTGLRAKNASDWNKGFGILSVKNAESINLNIVNTSQNELYHVYLKRESGGKDSIVSIGNNWERNFSSPDPEMYISGVLFSKPGKYTIIIRPEITAGYKQQIIIGSEVRAHFTVLPGPITLSLKTVEFIIVILLTTGGFMFMMYRRKQRQKLAREAQSKQIAMLQLQSVRAQLNPHFIFNALAGIQNLINKNEIEDANKYLTRFARLTRNVLDEGHKDLISIEQEISLLDDYLQMEQTRFGFKFNINVANNVDKQIEIPAMLIQPFAENAVKHGMSSLKDKGLVSIVIDEIDTDIVLTIHDNGKGFNKPAGTGKGIKLCEERIALLNSIYKKSTILLQIETGNEGTTITINLKSWL
ncbi:sensor histidine kinase [Mucilaginibacter sp. UYCu711]|uniref:sensor histidine kinase n=1 Tax=Mucilaginibacter sp. UYCu711 TaxID=3156339 RepID=UPI003D1F6858